MSTFREQSRSFSMDDQLAFAALSGDYNPLHLDPIAARRLLFGQVAVHGMHILLWGLDCTYAAMPEFRGLRKLRAHFDTPLAPGEKLDLTWDIGPDSLRARARRNGTTVLRLSASHGGQSPETWHAKTELDALECADPGIDRLAELQGTTNLVLPPSWKQLFPNLAIAVSPFPVAVLLACTRIVGMMCPGQHSIFSGLALRFVPEGGEPDAMVYNVKRFDPRVSLLDIDVRAGRAGGVLHAFRRPAPVVQPDFKRLLGAVAPAEFSRQKALVVGGSRGLGETTAKLLALGGADVTLTYATGRADADRIVAEGRSRGLRLASCHFDAHCPDMPHLGGPFTHLYYFATPRILVGKPGHFESDRFALLLDIYVTCLARTAEWLCQRAEPGCKLWMPSTIFLDERASQFPEYVAAKACAEALCAQLAIALPQIQVLTTRLPRLASDQTQSLLALEMTDSVEVMLATLREI